MGLGAAASQGWTAFILDTNGNGQRDAYVEPNDPVDPTMDKRINGGFYAVMPNPADGSIWGTIGVFAGTAGVARIDPGPNPPETAIAEVYNLPREGFGLRGGDIDKNGVVWVSASSGHLVSFDRRLCTGPLNGPEAGERRRCRKRAGIGGEHSRFDNHRGNHRHCATT